MPDQAQYLVELRNIELRSDRGEAVFKDLSLMIEPGGSAMIAGASGSGKSSLLDLLLGRRFPRFGSVEVFGKVLNQRKPRQIRSMRRRIGGVGGPFGLIPTMTVAENVLLPLVISGERPVMQKERLFKTLSELSLLSHAGDYPSRLTRVQSTLVQVARSTIANQPLVLIDEPSAGLDKATSAQVFEYLFNVAVSGRSLIIVSSEMPPYELPNCRRYQLEDGALR
jgi:putative ABC transport system ATP-binding protein